MIERIKNAALYVVTPITVIFGFIYFLLSKNRDLKEQLAETKAEAAQLPLQADEKITDSKASSAADEYAAARAEFLRFYSAEHAAVPKGDSDR